MRLIYLTLGWVAGIILAAAFDQSLPLFWLILTGLALLALWLGLDNAGQRMAMAALMAFTLGGLRFALIPTTSDVARYNNVGGLTIEGVVVEEPDVRDDRVQLRVAAETVTRAGQALATDGLVMVQAPPVTDARYGDRIRATGRLIMPAEFDTFSYADFLARSGVFSIMRNASVEVVAQGQGNPLYAGLLDLKRRAHETIGRYLPEPQAGLLTGILLGNERSIAPEVRDAFSAVGASHVMVISGFNMVILAGVVMGTLERLQVRRRRAAIIGLVVIGVYTIFVGANAAVVRAALMSGLVVIGQLIRRKSYVPTSLAFVALILSLLNPTVLWDISFQLSFFATLGITLLVPPLTRWFDGLLERVLRGSPDRTLAEALLAPLIVTLAAQATTLPLIALYFGRLSLLSLPVNLLIIPVQSPLLILGGLATLVSPALPGVAQVLYWFSMILLSWTIQVVRAFAHLSFAEAQIGVDPRLVAVLFVLFVGGAMLRATRPGWTIRLSEIMRRRAVIFATLLSGAGVIVLTGAVAFSRPDGYLHVWWLDVGHSNAVLAQTPGGAQMLVDGGRFPSRLLTAIGDRLPFMDREIEILAITQPDEFDYGAVTAMLARYDVGVALMNGHPNLGEAFALLQSALAEHEMVVVRAGYRLELDDGVQVEVLHPQMQPELGEALDDHTLVLRLRYGEASVLLTGDLSQNGQQELLEAGEWPLATVMQLPQHGAARSLDEGFLDAVQPQVAIVQVDPANQRGDPNPDTLAVLGGVPIFRTDEGGTIHLWTDGHELWVRQEG